MIDEKKLSKDICHYLFERIKNTSISKLSRKRNEQLVKMRNDIIDIINAQPQADKWQQAVSYYWYRWHMECMTG